MKGLCDNNVDLIHLVQGSAYEHIDKVDLVFRLAQILKRLVQHRVEPGRARRRDGMVEH
jgi:hypothetical protein